jgi:hypothetical protein
MLGRGFDSHLTQSKFFSFFPDTYRRYRRQRRIAQFYNPFPETDHIKKRGTFQ